MDIKKVFSLSALWFLTVLCPAVQAVNLEKLTVSEPDVRSGMNTTGSPKTVVRPGSLFHPLQFQEIIPTNYDKLRPPLVNGGHAAVYIKLSVLAMRSVNERDMTYEMDVFLHQYWSDPRLTTPSRYHESRVVLDTRWKNLMWTPDIFFKNARDGKLHDIIIPYTYLLVHNKTDVFLASRLTLKLNCLMDLTSYPHDEQECDVMIMSLTHTKDDLVLVWKDFEITRNILLAQFTVTHHSHGNCDLTYDIGVYSCLVGKIRLSRRLGYFLINKFVPSFLIVLVSFATFWIPPTAYPARVSLTVTSVLTIVTQQLASGNSAPDVSYVTALNIWMMGCIAFVFSTLLEYTVVVAVINSRRLRERALAKTNSIQLTSFACSSPAIVSLQDFNGRNGSKTPVRGQERPVERPVEHPGHMMDRVSRVLFPAFMAVFVFAYWSIYGRFTG